MAAYFAFQNKESVATRWFRVAVVAVIVLPIATTFGSQGTSLGFDVLVRAIGFCALCVVTVAFFLVGISFLGAYQSCVTLIHERVGWERVGVQYDPNASGRLHLGLHLGDIT